MLETGQGTITNNDGYYSIINVRPGTYTVEFRYIGFAGVRMENVQAIPDKTTTIDVQMREQVIEGEEVVVTAERPLVQMDRTTTTAFVDQAQIEALPVTSISDVVNLQAGVVDGHFRGGRSGEVAYLINGVPINNPLNNNAAFDIETNMVSGLEVISGVFNAEYGQAMSGVVNVVTRGVPSQWRGTFSAEVGGIASNRRLEFLRRNAEPGTSLSYTDFESEMVPYSQAASFPGRQDLQVSLGGPIVRDRLGFNLTGRYFYSQGNEIARRLFMPSDSSRNVRENAENPENWVIESTGDGSFAPDFTRRFSMTGNLGYRLSRNVRLEYNSVFQRANGWDLGWSNYHSNKYVPDGENRYYNLSQFHLAGVHLTFGANAFGNINYSYLRDKGESRLYDIPADFDQTGVLDPRYQPSNLGTPGVYAFSMGGNDLFNAQDLTETHTILADYTQQVTRSHQVKAGFLARMHRLFRGNYGIEVGPSTGYLPMPSTDPFGRDTLDVQPFEWAAYVQDKMEYRDLIVNVGLRFDYFNPDYDVPLDWAQANLLYIPAYDSNGQATGDSLLNRQASPAHFQLSPRLGIAFPISASGVIRFSAGLFFQTPPFSLLFQNPNYEVPSGASAVNFGNAALKPERTLHFEVGLQQGLTENLGLELTLFAKDIRNLTGVVISDFQGIKRVRYINTDVGASRGVTLSLFQRPVGPVSWDVDYTLQFATGTASNPNEAFQRAQNGLEETKTMERLDWDRRHVLTSSFTYAPSRALTASFINRYQTGRPYTTRRGDIISYIQNNEDRPSAFYSDLRFAYRMPFLKNLGMILQVENLFDTRGHNEIYDDTGRADESLEMERFRRTGATVGGLNSLDEYFVEQWRFSAPRRITFGLSYAF